VRAPRCDQCVARSNRSLTSLYACADSDDSSNIIDNINVNSISKFLRDVSVGRVAHGTNAVGVLCDIVRSCTTLNSISFFGETVSSRACMCGECTAHIAHCLAKAWSQDDVVQFLTSLQQNECLHAVEDSSFVGVMAGAAGADALAVVLTTRTNLTKLHFGE
jgi:hypothetical protein